MDEQKLQRLQMMLEKMEHSSSRQSYLMDEVSKRFEKFSDIVESVNEAEKARQKSADEIYRKNVIIDSEYLRKKRDVLELTNRQISQLKKEIETKEAEYKEALKTIDALNRLQEAGNELADGHKEEREQAEKVIESYKKNEKSLKNFEQGAKETTAELKRGGLSTKAFGAKINEVIEEQGSLKNVTKAVVVAFKSLILEAHRVSKESGGFYEGLSQGQTSFEQFGTILKQLGQTYYNAFVKLGVKPEDLARLNREYRQMVLTVGDANKAQELITTTSKDGLSIQEQYFRLTGNQTTAMSAAYQQMMLLRDLGIKPTLSSLQDMATTTTRVSQLTGMMPEEFNQLMDSVVNTTESIGLLRAMSMEQRQAFLKTNQTLLATNLALGMTKVQAQAAGRTLNEMFGAKPLDRIKQAARIRALGGAFGVEGAGDAAEALIAGSRATPEQKRKAMEFSTRMANRMDEMRGAGLGAEIMSTSMMEGLDLEKYFGKDSPFSTSLAMPIDKAAEKIGNTNNELTKIAKILATIGNIMDSTGMAALITAIGGLSLLVIGNIKALATNTGALLGKGAIPGGVGDIPGDVKDTKGKKGKIGRVLGRGAGLALRGGALGMAGYGGYELGEALYETETGYNAVQGALDLAFGGPKTDANTEKRVQEMIAQMKQNRDKIKSGAIDTETTKTDQAKTTEEQKNTIDQNLQEIQQSNKFLKSIADATTQQAEMFKKYLLMSTMSEEEKKKQIDTITRVNNFKSDSIGYNTAIQ